MRLYKLATSLEKKYSFGTDGDGPEWEKDIATEEQMRQGDELYPEEEYDIEPPIDSGIFEKEPVESLSRSTIYSMGVNALSDELASKLSNLFFTDDDKLHASIKDDKATIVYSPEYDKWYIDKTPAVDPTALPEDSGPERMYSGDYSALPEELKEMYLKALEVLPEDFRDLVAYIYYDEKDRLLAIDIYNNIALYVPRYNMWVGTRRGVTRSKSL